MAAVVATHLPFTMGTDFVEQKVFARHQPAHGRVVCRLAGYRRHRLEVSHGFEPGLDVHGAGLAIRADTIPVMEPVGHIARLLDLGHHQPGPDRMHRAGGNEDTVAAVWLEGMKDVATAAGAQGGGQLVAGGAGAEAGIDAAARHGVEDVPRLGLAAVGRSEPTGPGIVGMDLHRKVVTGIEKLKEQRKCRQRGVATEEFRAAGADKVAERGAGERTGRDHALVGAAVDQFP